MADLSHLQQLASVHGISPGFHDNWANYHEASEAELQQLLAAMGISASSGDAVPSNSVVMGSANAAVELLVQTESVADGNSWTWTVVSDDVETEHTSAPQKGQAQVLELCVSESSQMTSTRLRCDIALPCGYYSLSLSKGNFTVEQFLLVVPERAYQPALANKVSGVSTQLYSLVSSRNWGIGDFTDLTDLCTTLGGMGVDAVGLNPLHALYLHHPERCSPYSPSSRIFFNPLYLDVESVPGFASSEGVMTLVDSPSFAARLLALKNSTTVDYAAVYHCKVPVLRELHKYFCQPNLNGSLTAVREDYDTFVKQQGVALQLQARFEAFDLYFSQQQGLYSWRDWSTEFLDAHSSASNSLAEELATEIDFSCYLQWLCTLQIASVAKHCKDNGMQVGLYFDLAVGVDVNGAEPWTHSAAFAQGVHIGAPPDSLGPMGQDWSLVPYRPTALHDNRFAPYIAMLRANMQFAGALRIDHVMGLMRQYWCLPELTRETGIASGTYIDFPFQELLGIAKLESHRNGCLLIGEDLGTVPASLREQLDEAAVHRYRVLYFEKDHHSGLFNLPDQYPLQSLATATTHDLPTLAGFWTDEDLHARGALGLFPSPSYKEEQWQSRQRDKSNLLGLLRHLALLPAEAQGGDNTVISTRNFVDAVHRLMASSGSSLMMLQLEDLLLQKDMMNMPGTINEHLNWRRKLQSSLERLPAWLADETVLQEVVHLRKSAAG